MANDGSGDPVTTGVVGAETASAGTRVRPAPPSATGAQHSAIRRFWVSTVGKKIVMAVTGLIMLGFLVTHATANLLAYLGPDSINSYSRFLHQTPEVLWPARIVLLVSVVLHVTAAMQLTAASRAARPTGYELRESQIATFASRSIRWLSILLAVFIVVHLLHFTGGQLLTGFQERNPYANVVLAFTTQPVMIGFYLVMMVVVGLHVYHGAWSSIRTLGLSRPRGRPTSRPVAAVLAVALWLAFSLVPLGVALGVIRAAGPAPIVSAQR
jgi:succinate dehydrogenase cytochrome b subunit